VMQSNFEDLPFKRSSGIAKDSRFRPTN